LPSFVAQGEELPGEATAATVGDVIEVECNPTVYGTESKVKITANQLFSRCKGNLTWYVPNPFTETKGKPGVTLTLDPDGNATVALLAGPGCAAGESLISAHMEEEPFETFTTSFTVLPPITTPPGVFALPGTQVEDATSSGVATIVQAEFPGGSEKEVHIGSEELFHRCRIAPHVRWIRMNGTVEQGNGEEESRSDVQKVRLDNDGNAFVIAIGDGSCSPGTSLIEADLESKPFTTLTTTFTILPPQPTAEPAFTIEKLQRISGGSGGFTKATLTGSLGQNVEYEILVKNTAAVPETLSDFSDPHCDAGTIAGGPGASALPPAAATTYTCAHVLKEAGRYSNEATVTATTVGGIPLTQSSNQVLVEVPQEPGFVVEKQQQIAGSVTGFTAAPVTGAVGQTVDYQIRVTNTGNVPLKLSGFSDPHCDPGTIAGGPGEAPLAVGASTTYTCSHVLTTAGNYVNEASVLGSPPGEPSIPHSSNRVEVLVPEPPKVMFTIEKLQRIAGGAAFTTAPLLNGKVGQTLDYEMIVRNTGEVSLVFSSFSDPQCDKGTLAGGSGGAAVAPGSSTTYTCSRLMPTTAVYRNEATVTGTALGEPPVTKTSNQVEAQAAAGGVKPCKSVQPPFHGPTGPKSATFTVQVGSAGIEQITFLLDGRALKTLKRSQARGGKFAIRIDARRLSYGAHKLTIKTRPIKEVCGSEPRSSVFIHPKPSPPVFTG
jgi:hypothetical protein